MNHQRRGDREIITTDEFLSLSAALSYQLEARNVNGKAILALMVGKSTAPLERELVLQALEVVRIGYGDRRRRLGPFAVLHPIRTSALLMFCIHAPSSLHMLGGLLHDKDEDLTDLDGEQKAKFTDAYNHLMEMIDHNHKWFLGERLALLTRRPDQHYLAYVANLLDQAGLKMDVVHIKCADRLDNTLDVGLRPGLSLNWFRTVHDALFCPSYGGVHIEEYHHLPSDEEGADILAMLFKNLIFSSLLRQYPAISADPTTTRLADALSVASIRVAGWIALATLASGAIPVSEHRKFLLEEMDYISKGGLEVRRKGEGGDLDGMLLDYWDRQGDSKARKRHLAEVFRDRPRLLRVCALCIAEFASFLQDPAYFVKGIGRDAVLPRT
jgi:hypothetical protein